MFEVPPWAALAQYCSNEIAFSEFCERQGASRRFVALGISAAGALPLIWIEQYWPKAAKAGTTNVP